MVQNYRQRLIRTFALKDICSQASTFNIFLERIMSDVLEDHVGSVSIGGWHITNMCFADLIVVNPEEEDEAGVLVSRLDTTIKTHKKNVVWS